MERVNRILNNQEYKACCLEIEELEKDRIFCRHHMEHFLSVARLAMLLNMERGLGIEKELIYASALLHDIGRGEQYKTGIRHEISSAEKAPVILEACGFQAEEIKQICAAIAGHRDADSLKEWNLKGILYRADKLSRSCFCCSAEQECDKAAEKKLKYLNY